MYFVLLNLFRFVGWGSWVALGFFVRRRSIFWILRFSFRYDLFWNIIFFQLPLILSLLLLFSLSNFLADLNQLFCFGHRYLHTTFLHWMIHPHLFLSLFWSSYRVLISPIFKLSSRATSGGGVLGRHRLAVVWTLAAGIGGRCSYLGLFTLLAFTNIWMRIWTLRAAALLWRATFTVFYLKCESFAGQVYQARTVLLLTLRL